MLATDEYNLVFYNDVNNMGFIIDISEIKEMQIVSPAHI